MDLFKTTALASTQASFSFGSGLASAQAIVLTIRACFAHALRASDKRTEPEAESKAEAVVLKRAIKTLPIVCCHLAFPSLTMPFDVYLLVSGDI